jgi:Putative Ig domain
MQKNDLGWITKKIADLTDAINHQTKEIKTMATKQDLDAAEATLTTAISKLASDFNAAFVALQAAIAAGGGDLTPEVAALATINNSVQTLDAQINADNPALMPVISSPITATGTVGTAFSYQIVASNTPTSFDATGLPSGLTVDTAGGAISGTPTVAGVTAITLKATNTNGTGIATLTLTVS